MDLIKTGCQRLGDILKALDGLAADMDSEDLEELNAEFEDALMLLGELDPREEEFGEELIDVLEELKGLAGDYRRLAGGQDELVGLIARLEAEITLAEKAPGA